MTVARSQLVNLSETRWYHCISRCVRGASLLAQGEFDRKGWIEKRLQTLSSIFAISVSSYAVMDNHLHMCCRIDPEVAQAWSAEDVARRWYELFPKRDKEGEPLPITDAWIEDHVVDAVWVEKMRARLQELGWLMKCLKEPLSRLINSEEGKRGTLFEGRYKSIAILDEASLLATNAYIDLNPVAAGIAQTPEQSAYTSVKQRTEHVAEQDRLDDLEAAREGKVAASKRAKFLEENLWLCPIEDRRRLLDTEREGMLEGFPFASYLLFLDFVGRKNREGKASIPAELDCILTRLGCDAGCVADCVGNLMGKRLRGHTMAMTQERLDQAASRLGLSRVINLHGQETL